MVISVEKQHWKRRMGVGGILLENKRTGESCTQKYRQKRKAKERKETRKEGGK